MPNNLIQKIHQEKNISINKLEKIWDNAILQAEKNNINNKYAYATFILEKILNNTMAYDSEFIIDDNEFTWVPNCIITSVGVFEYEGHEIPNYELLGLDVNKTYKLYRPANEIKKAKDTFKNMPLLDKHIIVYADDLPQGNMIGTLSNDVNFDGEDLTCTIVFWDKEAFDLIKQKDKKGLSAGYRYTPILKSGIYNGQAYDIIMTELSANHVAHVEKPRNEKSEIIINDSKSLLEGEGTMPKHKISLDQETGENSDYDKIIDMLQNDPELKEKLLKFLTPAEDEDKEEKEAEETEEKKEDKKPAMDSASLKLIIQNEIKKQLREYNEAVDICEKHIGVVNRQAFDSADALYTKVLKDNKIACDGLETSAKKLAVSVLNVNKKELTTLAYDNQTSDITTALKERGF